MFINDINMTKKITFKDIADKIKEGKPFLIPTKVKILGQTRIGELGYDPDNSAYLFLLTNSLRGYPSNTLMKMSKYPYSYALILHTKVLDIYDFEYIIPTLKKLKNLKIL